MTIQKGDVRKKLDPWPVLEAGALLTLTGLSQAAVAQRLGIAQSTANARLRRHRTLLDTGHRGQR